MAGGRGALRDWLHGAPAGMAVLGTAVGVGAGFGAVVFRYLILWFTELFSGHRDYSAVGRVANPHVPWLGVGFLVLAPVVGGAVYGPLIACFAPEARGHGVPEVMLAVAERGGRISPAVALVKSVASAICIGSGGSVGREGPIVQIGSALGSTIGQALRVPESRLRLLVACGAAGGISATFNAPIAGVMFALELILRSFEAELFAVVVLASVAADVIGRAAFGDHAFLALGGFRLVSPIEYPFYLLLGVLAGAVGVGFIRVLYGVEDACDRIWRGPDAIRPIVGGLALGGLLLAVPQMYGVGYPVLERGIAGHYAIAFLLVLLCAKLLATSLTIGIGGSGGVFAPSLFIGAMLGSAYGSALHQLLPHQTGPAGAYGLVGMGAVFAASSRAPITALVIIFELTGDYRIMLPLMLAIVLATTISRHLSHDTIYTLKLRRRGIDLDHHRLPPLERLSVALASRPLPEPLSPELSLAEVVSRFEACDEAVLPVVDDHQQLRGILARREVETALIGGHDGDTTAADLAVVVQALHGDDTLQTALARLVVSPGALPVLTPGTQELAGWLTEGDVLKAYAQHLSGATDASPTPADG